MLIRAFFHLYESLPLCVIQSDAATTSADSDASNATEGQFIERAGSHFYNVLDNSVIQTYMNNGLDWLKSVFMGIGLGSSLSIWLAWGIFLVALIALSFVLHRITKLFIRKVVDHALGKLPGTWGTVLRSNNILTRLAHIVPIVLLGIGVPLIVPTWLRPWVISLLDVYVFWVMLLVGFGVIELIAAIYRDRQTGDTTPVEGIVQAAKLVLVVVVGLFVLSALFSKSPLWFLSGIGAFMALVLLIFRDSLLGLVAGLQLSANDMVRVGDWIEIPGAGVDGDVLEVTLTTVRVSNWDRTIALVPAYDLFQNPFINWRGMSDSGGRRIKRSICIDLATIKFATPELLAAWSKIELLQSYMKRKESEIAEWNDHHGATEPGDINARRQTNIGAFRAYVEAYLRAHPKVHQDHFTFLVRQLQPTVEGLPIEVYVFANDNRWEPYEAIQADIFDHLLAIVTVFELEVATAPSGSDVRSALNPAAAAARH